MNTNATLRARAVGFGGYSEGAADDYNKALWSALYMEPGLSVDAFTEQYASHFLHPATATTADAATHAKQSTSSGTSVEANDGAALLFGCARTKLDVFVEKDDLVSTRTHVCPFAKICLDENWNSWR
jgi:hypothetical protein